MKNKLFAAVIVFASVATAQEEDAPGKGVARLSLISGDVSIKRGDTGEWVAAAVNGPLLAGDQVLSAEGSRAEVQFDWANLVRLSSNAEVRLSEVDKDRYQIQLARGTIMFAVLRDSSADVDISTPSVSIRPFVKGLYRVTVRDGQGGPVTEISVRSGEADIFSPRGTQRLRSGHTMQVRGSTGDPEFQNVADLPDDDWDRWNDRRNKEMLRSTSYNYVDRGIYGADDLDNYGTWSNVAPYGWVWSPRVASGWAPYRYGRWNHMDYYGWNWISYDPWGWAPYHYGRWFQTGNRWCWWPGGIGVRPFWRPALVAWVGWGGSNWAANIGVGGGIGYGWGHIGWLPLAPYEPFYPWYGRGFYGRNVGHRTTIVNNINITNVYRNARVNNGVTVVQADQFGRGHVNNIQVDASRLERASAARGALPVVPDRAATRMSDREVRVGAVARETGREQFYSRREVPRAERMSFDDQRRNAEQITRNTFGNPAGGDPAGQGVRNERATRSPENVQGSRQIGQTGDGWRRVGEAGNTGAGRDGSRSTLTPDASGGNTRQPSQVEGGWRRFGEPRDSGRQAIAPGINRGGSTATENDGWRQMGERSRENAATGGRQSIGRESTPRDSNSRDASRGDRTQGWQSFGSVPDAGSGRAERMGRGDRSFGSINVNPPVVRDRSFGGSSRSMESPPSMNMPRSERMSPRMEAPNRGSFGGGGGGMSSPRMSAPQMSAPRMSAPPVAAPRSVGPSGGGGGGRSAGGGGGNSRGGGGGGGRRN